MSHFSNLESDIDYVFDFGSIDEEDTTAKYLDFDIDDEYFYTLIHEEMYLMYNCRFFFDLYGGETILDHIDFIDFNIYNVSDNRNFKNIYLDIKIYKNYLKSNFYELYNIKQYYINNNNENLYIKKIEQLEHLNNNNKELNNLYNMINNQHNINYLKKKQKYEFIIRKYKNK